MNKIVEKFVWLVVGVVLMGFGTWLFRSPPHEPDVIIEYDTIEKTPFKYDNTGRLRIDYETDRDIFGFYFRVVNKGLAKDTNLKIDIYTVDENCKIIENNIVYIPKTLEENVKKKSSPIDKNRFFRVIDPFPSDAKIFFNIMFSSTINEKDLNFSFLSDNRNWQPKKAKIDIRGPFAVIDDGSETGIAYAKEPNDQIKFDSIDKSEISIGGYNPLRLANNLLAMLEKEKFIERNEAEEIKDNVVGEQKIILFGGKPVIFGKQPALFGGIDILKFNNLMVDALIKNKKITNHQALEIIEKSKRAGGIMISGYNVIVLDIEIMNTLIRNGFLDLKTAQSVLDSSRHKLLSEDGKGILTEDGKAILME